MKLKPETLEALGLMAQERGWSVTQCMEEIVEYFLRVRHHLKGYKFGILEGTDEEVLLVPVGEQWDPETEKNVEVFDYEDEVSTEIVVAVFRELKRGINAFKMPELHS